MTLSADASSWVDMLELVLDEHRIIEVPLEGSQLDRVASAVTQALDLIDELASENVLLRAKLYEIGDIP